MIKKHEKHSISCECGHEHEGNEGKFEIIKIAAGGLIFVVGMVASHIFDVANYISFALFLVSYMILGGEVLLRAAKNIAKGRIFDENFLMSAATVGAFAIGEYPEAAAVMLFYQIGEYFQGAATRKSKKSIAELMDIRPDFANIIREGEIVKVSPESVNIGDIIIVKPGEKIPLDGIVIEGESTLDTSALTGEAVPKKAAVSDMVLSGCINQSGVLSISVTKRFGESTVSVILELVENAANKKAPVENFITKFARYYTPAVVGLAVLIAILPPLVFDGIWFEWINRGLIFLVISCPCALVVSIPLSFFGGIGGASKKGVLVKGGNFLEALNKVDIVVFDKTGTLTKGVFEVTRIQPSNGFGENELLELAAAAEAFSNHPIAASVSKAYGQKIDTSALFDYTETAGRGVSVRRGESTIYAGNCKFMEMQKIEFSEFSNSGTNIYVAKDGIFAGCITISDDIKPDSKKTIAALKKKGVRKTVMLTGDNAQIAKTVAETLEIDEYYGGLLPCDKIEKLEMLTAQKRSKGKLAFVGDGINDAPVLAQADIGIAMGKVGSDAAIEAADVVLMTDEPSKLIEAIEVAQLTKRIVAQNIICVLFVKGVFLLLGALGLADMWEAVFADVGMALLAVLNAMRAKSCKNV